MKPAHSTIMTPQAAGNSPEEIKYTEFRKWLTQQGAVFKSAKGSHFKVYRNGRQTIFPDHGSKEIGQGLVQKIKKDLDLK